MLKIREGKVEDMEVIKNIADSVLRRHFWMSWTKEDMFKPYRKVVVCEIENKVVGFAVGSSKQNKGYLLAVSQNYQNQGVGTLLLEQFDSWHVIQQSIDFFNKNNFKTVKLLKKSTKGRRYDTYLVEKSEI